MSLSEKIKHEVSEKGLVVHWPLRLKDQGSVIEKALDAFKAQNNENVPKIRLEYQSSKEKNFLLPEQWSKHPIIGKDSYSESDLPLLSDFVSKLKKARSELNAQDQDNVLFGDNEIMQKLVSDCPELEICLNDESAESDSDQQIKQFQLTSQEQNSDQIKIEIKKDDLQKSLIIVLIIICVCLVLRLI